MGLPTCICFRSSFLSAFCISTSIPFSAIKRNFYVVENWKNNKNSIQESFYQNRTGLNIVFKAFNLIYASFNVSQIFVFSKHSLSLQKYISTKFPVYNHEHLRQRRSRYLPALCSAEPLSNVSSRTYLYVTRSSASIFPSTVEQSLIFYFRLFIDSKTGIKLRVREVCTFPQSARDSNFQTDRVDCGWKHGRKKRSAVEDDLVRNDR